MKRAFVCAAVLLTAGQAFAQSVDRNEGYRIANALEQGDGAAADDLLNTGDGKPDLVATFLGQWSTHLIRMKRFDVVEKLADVVIQQRPYMWPNLADAQKGKVEALLAEEKFPEALIEAKRYYNVCLMSRTDDALSYIAMAMRGANTPDVEQTIKTMLAEQRTPAPADRTLANDLTARTAPASGVLTTIKTDSALFDAAIGQDLGSTAFEIQFGRGNLLLLAGNPGKAKACFEKAAESADAADKTLTRAIEGVARSIRAEDASVGRANAFLAELQQEPKH